jgi:hypothetical protein
MSGPSPSKTGRLGLAFVLMWRLQEGRHERDKQTSRDLGIRRRRLLAACGADEIESLRVRVIFAARRVNCRRGVNEVYLPEG